MASVNHDAHEEQWSSLEDLMDYNLAAERLEQHDLSDARPFSKLKERYGMTDVCADDFEDELV